MARLPTLIFDHAPTPSPQTFEQLLIFVTLYQHAKNQLFQLFILQIQTISGNHHQTRHTSF